jgi:hypothetical protein
MLGIAKKFIKNRSDGIFYGYLLSDLIQSLLMRYSEMNMKN